MYAIQHAKAIFAGINNTPNNPQNIISSLLYIHNPNHRVSFAQV